MNGQPQVSVIVPVYNVRDYVDECLQSILNQTARDFELIIADDGSDDGTSDICRKYLEKDSRIKYLKTARAGVSGARNSALAAARGAFIAFIDGDDYVHPAYLETLTRLAEDNNADIACVNVLEPRGYVPELLTTDHEEKKERPAVIKGEKLIAEMFNHILFQAVWGKLYRRETIGENLFEAFRMGEDMEFNSRVYPRSEGIVYKDVSLYFRRQRPGSACTSSFSKIKFDQITSTFRALENVTPLGEKFEAEGLKKLYKFICSVGYDAPENYCKDYRELKKRMLESTKKRFAKNPYVSPVFKAGIRVFLLVPYAYRLFRIINEKAARP